MNNEQQPNAADMIVRGHQAWKERRNYLSGLVVGIVTMSIAFWLGTILHDHKPNPAPPPTVNWIGKFAAGDGNGRVFTANNLEIGIATDGTLRVREVAVPIRLTSNTNTP